MSGAVSSDRLREAGTAAILAELAPLSLLSAEVRSRLTERARLEDVPPGQSLFDAGQPAHTLCAVIEGTLDVEVPSRGPAPAIIVTLGPGDFFGFECLLPSPSWRASRARAITNARILSLDGDDVNAALLLAEPPARADLAKEGTVSRRLFDALNDDQAAMSAGSAGAPNRRTAIQHSVNKLGNALTSPRLYLALIGFAIFFGLWQLSVDTLRLPRFKELPTLVAVVREWFSTNPDYGLSIFVGEYYNHILISLERVGLAFFLATMLGVPLGLSLGWSKKFREYIFPLFEILRPVPILAWVPLAIVMLPSDESAVIFLTFIAAFFATTLNTMLGVQSIDTSYIRAAYCLGASHKQVFRHVVVPGALPFIFTGLQIAVGIAWFSLVAAEMVSGQFGLGYVINTAYTKIQYPVIVIGMVTLGFVGYTTSALVRYVGRRLMAWRERELALSGVH